MLERVAVVLLGLEEPGRFWLVLERQVSQQAPEFSPAFGLMKYELPRRHLPLCTCLHNQASSESNHSTRVFQEFSSFDHRIDAFLSSAICPV